ncbi:hypothetical protein [Microvirga lotononidis]|uniref:Uncharacterized protein n=1 Tax=Microvirga lotononidis TaxID=864069 RepID=I4Z2L8_9HYPH|nr:hypothetical protein [Microvirga lotononidis]EIM30460.1 hypothetical protein MicloDRAFT_00007090 [Microvirga lotononidis]WQO26301.1 hypothetical protein U0023_16580 [Microvirga lotononidis]
MQNHTKTALTILVCAPLIALAGYLTVFFWLMSPCEASAISTEIDAVEFSKYWLRRDDSLWRADGIQSLTNLNQALEKNDCCVARAINPEANDEREWVSTVKLVRSGEIVGLYEVAFTSCRSKVRTKIVRRGN